MKKIVVLESKSLGEIDYSPLNEFGQVELYEETRKDQVFERIKDANIVLTNKVVLDESNLKNASKLELICEEATGYNNVDVNYCGQHNIAVTNVAGYSTSTVAQHTFATLLSLYNKISYYDNYVKSGDYSKSGMFSDVSKNYYDLEGKKMGIVGLGAIGKRVAKIAESFGIEVVYYSTSGRNSDKNYKRVELDELLSTCDIISIHAPLNENTLGLFNYDNLKKMKKNAVLINMGRGPIVVDADLAKAIDEGLISGAALDVFEVEPIKENNELLKIKNKDKLILTPHVAWASVEARNRLFNSVIDNIRSYYKGEKKNRVEIQINDTEMK